MSIRWKLFGIANYLLLLEYLLLLAGAVQFILKEISTRKDLISFMPLALSMLFIIFGAGLNLYIFHKHIPEKPIPRRLKYWFFISAVLFTLSVGTLLVSLLDDLKNELTSPEDDSFSYFLTIIFSSTLLLGTYVAIHQFLVGKYILERHQKSIKNVIDRIGKDE